MAPLVHTSTGRAEARLLTGDQGPQTLILQFVVEVWLACQVADLSHGYRALNA